MSGEHMRLLSPLTRRLVNLSASLVLANFAALDISSWRLTGPSGEMMGASLYWFLNTE